MGSETRLAPAPRNELAIRLKSALAVQHLPQEDPAPPLYPEWTNYVNRHHINDLAASGDELWTATRGGVVRWRWDGDRICYTLYGSEHGLPGSDFDCIRLDSQGRPWAGGKGKGLSYLEGIHWHTMNSEHGLPSRDVYCLANAPNGDLWVGTANGLGRVLLENDTPEWQPYSLSRANLPADEVRALAIGPDGSLWIGTSWGLYHYIPSDSRWYHYTMANGLSDNEVSHLLFDSQGKLWIGTVRGLCIWDGSQFAHCPEIPSAIWSIAAEQEANGLWVVAAGTIWRSDGEEWVKIPLSPIQGIFSSARAVVAADRERVWVGFERGLVQAKPERRVLSLPIDLEFSGDSVNAIAVDDMERVWVGTPSGLWIQEKGRWRQLRPNNELASPFVNVESIVVSPGGEVWAGSWARGEHGGLRQFVGRVEVPRRMTGGPASVDAMSFDSDGRLWIAAEGVIWRLHKEEWKEVTEFVDPGVLVNAVLVDGLDRLWCGSTEGLLCYDDGWTQWFSRENICALAQGPENTLWVGSDSGSSRVTVDAGNHPTVTEKATDICVFALAVTEEEVWAGTEQGLQVITDESRMITVDQHGLANNVIQALALDAGVLWIGTANGLSRLAIDER